MARKFGTNLLESADSVCRVESFTAMETDLGTGGHSSDIYATTQ